MRYPFLLLAILGLMLSLVSSLAEEAEDPTAKMREALRNTMLQLREAQAKTAEMEAASVQSQLEADKLKKEVVRLQAQMVDERNLAVNQQAELRAELEKRGERVTHLEAQVAKYQSDYKTLIEKARKIEHAEALAKARISTLERTVAELQVKNVEMKNVADEILDRYSKHSLGSTLLAREPFISVNRAKLQTTMQDLETRIRASMIVP